MGQNISLQVFQAVNNIHITLASGILGATYILKNIIENKSVKPIVVSILMVSLLRLAFKKEKLTVSKRKVVFISGCDSGLGFSIALHANFLGFTVIAGCLNLNSNGAKELLKNKNIYVLELDITAKEHIENSVRFLEDFFQNHDDYVLHSLINNAGIMVFGEFEWQTYPQILDQIGINIAGTINLTHAMLPILRKNGGRIITVTSHCADQSLPGLAVYGATKSALKSWCDSLRVELSNHGVKVITFLPGSLITQTNIMSRVRLHADQMKDAMSNDQIDYYGDYFDQYYQYLGALAVEKAPKKIDDRGLYDVFEGSLVDKFPRFSYIYEPWRYTFYHTLAKYSPAVFRDYFIVKFVNMPQWTPKHKV